MTICETAMALVATNIGGALLGFPYAYYHCGLTLSIILTVVLGIITHVSSMMYLKTKDLTPYKLESIYEIAFLLFGRSSIFVVCSIMFLSNYFAIVLFYMIIGETWSTLIKQALIGHSSDMSVTEIDTNLEEYPWYVQIAT